MWERPAAYLKSYCSVLRRGNGVAFAVCDGGGSIDRFYVGPIACRCTNDSSRLGRANAIAVIGFFTRPLDERGLIRTGVW